MAKKDKSVVIAYFPSEDKAKDAADQLKSWEKATDGIKLGGINILTWKDGKIKTSKVGGRDAGKDAGWGTALGALTGMLSGGVTLIAGAATGAVGGGVLGEFFHKNVGLTDADKTELDAKLKKGDAALVATVDTDEVEPTKKEMATLGGTVDDYKVPQPTQDAVAKTTTVKPAASASSDSSSAPAAKS